MRNDICSNNYFYCDNPAFSGMRGLSYYWLLLLGALIMRSTQKFINGLLDNLKWDLNLKSRKDASRYFYTELGHAFERKGYKLSYYLNNQITVTKDNIQFFNVPYDMLWQQHTFIRSIKQ